MSEVLFPRLAAFLAVASLLSGAVRGILRCVWIQRVGRRPIYTKATVSGIRWWRNRRYSPVILNYYSEGGRVHAVSYRFLSRCLLTDDLHNGMDVTIAYHPDYPGHPVVSDDWGFWRTALLAAAFPLAAACGAAVFFSRLPIW